ANVARGSRAIASWSATYGITDEQTPTPIPQASQTGWVNAGQAPLRPTGAATTAAISMAAPTWSIPDSAEAPAGSSATGVFATWWPSITRVMKPAQLPHATTNLI